MNTLNVILKWVKELDKKHCFALIGFLVISAGLLVCISQATAGVNGKEPAQFNGVFRFAYPPVKSPGPAALRQSFMADKALENVTAGLNSLIAVPADITIAFTECGVINAFYEPSARRVNMCYELIEHFAQLFLPYAKSEEALGKAV